jgi:hypothetical protein
MIGILGLGVVLERATQDREAVTNQGQRGNHSLHVTLKENAKYKDVL